MPPALGGPGLGNMPMHMGQVRGGIPTSMGGRRGQGQGRRVKHARFADSDPGVIGMYPGPGPAAMFSPFVGAMPVGMLKRTHSSRKGFGFGRAMRKLMSPGCEFFSALSFPFVLALSSLVSRLLTHPTATTTPSKLHSFLRGASLMRAVELRWNVASPPLPAQWGPPVGVGFTGECLRFRSFSRHPLPGVCISPSHPHVLYPSTRCPHLPPPTPFSCPLSDPSTA